MNIIMNFHQMEPSPAIKDMVAKKSEKLKKFFEGSFDLKWTMSVDKEGHRSHALLTGDGLNINAHSVKEDMYKTLDEVVAKLARQLGKQKNASKSNLRYKPDFYELE